jgi:hypothetical protein
MEGREAIRPAVLSKAFFLKPWRWRGREGRGAEEIV